ncbi:cupin domain-containing protein [Kiloniella sp. EL199]|uniref:cupin domain-containing protein n=1 Tax=Kiloniella sp. EL199 TaxID=2107581 RepID=UPI000EA1EDB4|nr:cupin domain-containing protein [Kiloniella sp. EL199]
MLDQNIVNLPNALKQVTDHWSPQTLAQVNDHCVKVAKIKDEYAWHKHDEDDELLYVVKGSLLMHYKDKTLELNEGDLHVIPKGIMHKPFAEEECWIVLLAEPELAVDTENSPHDTTANDLEGQMQSLTRFRGLIQAIACSQETLKPNKANT